MLTAEVLRPAGAARSKGLGCFPTRPLCINKDIACKALCVQKHCLQGFVRTKALLAAEFFHTICAGVCRVIKLPHDRSSTGVRARYRVYKLPVAVDLRWKAPCKGTRTLEQSLVCYTSRVLSTGGGADLLQQRIAQIRCETALFCAVVFGCIIHSKVPFLHQIFKGKARTVCHGLVLLVPLPQLAPHKALVDFPKLARAKAFPAAARAARAAFVACWSVCLGRFCSIAASPFGVSKHGHAGAYRVYKLFTCVKCCASFSACASVETLSTRLPVLPRLRRNSAFSE